MAAISWLSANKFEHQCYIVNWRVFFFREIGLRCFFILTDIIILHISACMAGTWGVECQQNCSENCARGNLECDRRDGTCIGGCLPGFYGDLCESDQPSLRKSYMSEPSFQHVNMNLNLLVCLINVVCMFARGFMSYFISVQPYDEEEFLGICTYILCFLVSTRGYSSCIMPQTRDVTPDQSCYTDIRPTSPGYHIQYKVLVVHPEFDYRSLDSYWVWNM